MQPTLRRLFRIFYFVCQPLLLLGIFFMLFWSAWGRASQSFDHGQAELLLHMITGLLMIPALLSIGSLFLALWCFRGENIFEVRQDRRYAIVLAAIFANGMVMMTVNGVYAGLAYAFFLERVFPLEPYELDLRMAVFYYLMAVIGFQFLVGIAMAIAKRESSASGASPSA